MWHCENPEFLNDNDVHELVDVIIEVQRAVRKTFKGRIKIVGPFPRLLQKCCDEKNHKLRPTAPFVSIVDYYDALNHYLAIHPKLKFFNCEFVPYNMIFDTPFDEDCLKDNIHLAEDTSDTFAEFILNLPKWDRKFYKPLDFDHPAFYTWVATVRRTSTVQSDMIATQPAGGGGESGDADRVGMEQDGGADGGLAAGGSSRTPAQDRLRERDDESMEHSSGPT